MAKVIDSLGLERQGLRQQDALHPMLENTDSLKRKLLQEMVVLEQQLQALEATSHAFDFSLQQAYKEMVHSRKQLFNELSR